MAARHPLEPYTHMLHTCRFVSNCFVMGVEVITSTLPPALWLIACSVAVRLESVATDGCSVAGWIRHVALQRMSKSKRESGPG